MSYLNFCHRLHSNNCTSFNVVSLSSAGVWLMFSSKGEPPSCSQLTINSTNTRINCSVTYGDSSYHPIDAKMTWTSDGHFYRNDTPWRKRVDPYFVSTSSVIVDARITSSYQCTVTFTNPKDIQFLYVATNAPKFSTSCKSSGELLLETNTAYALK